MRGHSSLPGYAASTDIDAGHKYSDRAPTTGRGHELRAAGPLSRSSAPTSKVRGQGFRTRLGGHGLASLTHALAKHSQVPRVRKGGTACQGIFGLVPLFSRAASFFLSRNLRGTEPQSD